MIIKPHNPYRSYTMPMFIIHATDKSLKIRSECGDVTIRDLASFTHSRGVLYSCVPWDNLFLYGSIEAWTVHTWNGKISSANYGDVRIVSLEMPYDNDVPLFFQWLDNRGIAAASLNTMSMNIWRSTLETSAQFTEEPNAAEYLGLTAITIGGRKEARPGRYRKRIEYDISAAYPNAFQDGIPSRLVPYPGNLRNLGNSGWDGIATAKVRIPPLKWGPLPVNLDSASALTCYGYTKSDEWVDVTLPLSELRMAESVGTDVLYQKASVFLDPVTVDPFDRWLKVCVPEMRALRGSAGKLGKLVANRLWSCFAISPNGSRKEHRYVNGTVVSTESPPDSPALTLRRSASVYVGSLIASRVRERVYRDGLLRLPDCVYVDTDGVISKSVPDGDIPPGWRVKNQMRTVEIAAAQAYRFTCSRCLPPGSGGHCEGHFVVAGASTLEEKSRLFHALKGGKIIVANISNVLPSQDMGGFSHATQETDESQSEAFAIFGGT